MRRTAALLPLLVVLAAACGTPGGRPDTVAVETVTEVVTEAAAPTSPSEEESDEDCESSQKCGDDAQDAASTGVAGVSGQIASPGGALNSAEDSYLNMISDGYFPHYTETERLHFGVGHCKDLDAGWTPGGLLTAYASTESGKNLSDIETSIFAAASWLCPEYRVLYPPEWFTEGGAGEVDGNAGGTGAPIPTDGRSDPPLVYTFESTEFTTDGLDAGTCRLGQGFSSTLFGSITDQYGEIEYVTDRESQGAVVTSDRAEGGTVCAYTWTAEWLNPAEFYEVRVIAGGQQVLRSDTLPMAALRDNDGRWTVRTGRPVADDVRPGAAADDDGEPMRDVQPEDEAGGEPMHAPYPCDPVHQPDACAVEEEPYDHQCPDGTWKPEASGCEDAPDVGGPAAVDPMDCEGIPDDADWAECMGESSSDTDGRMPFDEWPAEVEEGCASAPDPDLCAAGYAYD